MGTPNVSSCLVRGMTLPNYLNGATAKGIVWLQTTQYKYNLLLYPKGQCIQTNLPIGHCVHWSRMFITWDSKLLFSPSIH